MITIPIWLMFMQLSGFSMLVISVAYLSHLLTRTNVLLQESAEIRGIYEEALKTYARMDNGNLALLALRQSLDVPINGRKMEYPDLHEA
jgi:hypothetical protein